jgi:hypothetical protein
MAAAVHFILFPTRPSGGADALGGRRIRCHAWRGLSFAAVLHVAVMLGWAVLLALIAVWRFDWDAD